MESISDWSSKIGSRGLSSMPSNQGVDFSKPLEVSGYHPRLDGVGDTQISSPSITIDTTSLLPTFPSKHSLDLLDMSDLSKSHRKEDGKVDVPALLSRPLSTISNRYEIPKKAWAVNQLYALPHLEKVLCEGYAQSEGMTDCGVLCLLNLPQPISILGVSEDTIYSEISKISKQRGHELLVNERTGQIHEGFIPQYFSNQRFSLR